ncbi:VOC family protein [Dyadobacter pollutisoli]|jgi:hypothetical protein|uniref:VOC family protein n=1 Tax=Dyadobacter pollutisoli TaxID=2910158 RepID=A0A9E8N5E7_9BACT|nr:hypothetical protein [Dyadobacter pollutisoli]WAC10135.1 hypothetical protein ON006_20525 [Dyadobacter pollutisoli]
MANGQTLRGMAMVNFWGADMKAARAWYSELFGIDPYFQRPDDENPAYIEFRLGDYQHEFGIIDSNVLGIMYNQHYLDILEGKNA